VTTTTVNAANALTAATPSATTTPSMGGATVTVSNSAELWDAISKLHGGETVLLEPGTYDSVYGTIPIHNFNFSDTVTFQSADPTHQAVITNLEVVNTSNVAFNNLTFATTSGNAAAVYASHNVAFSNDVFQGAGTSAGSAMIVRDSDHVTVTGSDISKLWGGINEFNSSNLTVANNTFHDLQDDGVRGTDVTNSAITGNTFANANPLLANHSDAIYLWQDNAANHVTISGNTYGSGGTDAPPTTTPPATTPSTGTSTSAGSSGSSSSGSSPTTVTVSNTTELSAALKNAHGGDTILLKAGTYDGVQIYGLGYNGTVTIQSADPTHQALINNLDIEGSSGIAVKNVNVDVTGTSNYAVYVGDASHISLDHLTVFGTQTVLTGVGVMVRNSNDVSVTNSDLSKLGSGIGHLDGSGLTISNNTLHDLEADGVFGGGTSHVVVSGNNFSSFFTWPGDHPDAIQFWSGSNDVQITNNVITRGDGNAFQGIFLEDTNNITITGNAMAGTMGDGISLARSSNAVIENNFLNEYTDQGTAIIVRGGSANVTAVHNAAFVSNYAADGVNPNFVGSDNTLTAPSEVGDLTALKAWLSAHAGVTATTTGGDGSDTLTGTAGADTMSGGLGDDAYIVNHAGDAIVEAANAGVDTVNSSISSYTLGANVENLALTGTTAQTGVGNELNNVLIGNDVHSTLVGGAGNDTLVSMAGATTLTGGAGSDVFSIGAAPTSAVQITDFVSGQDKLDLHTLLANYHGSDPVADNWVQFQATSSGLSVLVDVDGPTGPAGYVAVAKLAGVNSLAASDWIFH
jgi:parallel beta-helix repeat protein